MSNRQVSSLQASFESLALAAVHALTSRLPSNGRDAPHFPDGINNAEAAIEALYFRLEAFHTSCDYLQQLVDQARSAVIYRRVGGTPVCITSSLPPAPSPLAAFGIGGIPGSVVGTGVDMAGIRELYQAPQGGDQANWAPEVEDAAAGGADARERGEAPGTGAAVAANKGTGLVSVTAAGGQPGGSAEALVNGGTAAAADARGDALGDAKSTEPKIEMGNTESVGMITLSEAQEVLLWFTEQLRSLQEREHDKPLNAQPSSDVKMEDAS